MLCVKARFASASLQLRCFLCMVLPYCSARNCKHRIPCIRAVLSWSLEQAVPSEPNWFILSLAAQSMTLTPHFGLQQRYEMFVVSTALHAQSSWFDRCTGTATQAHRTVLYVTCRGLRIALWACATSLPALCVWPSACAALGFWVMLFFKALVGSLKF